jgi:hypothetical protein
MTKTLNGTTYELKKFPFGVLKIMTYVDGINSGDYVIDNEDQFESKVNELDELFN